MNRFTQSSWLLALFCLVQTGAWAQRPDQYAYARPDSASAYWRLRTTPTDQTPTVQFYDPHHQWTCSLLVDAVPGTKS